MFSSIAILTSKKHCCIQYRFLIIGFYIILFSFDVLSQESIRFELYEDHHEQFIVWLPEGWDAIIDESKYEPNLKTSVGKIVFGLKNSIGKDWKKKKENIEKYNTGEIPSFSLQRFPLKFDIHCGSFSKTEQREVLRMVYKDPMFDRKNKHLEMFRGDTVSVGGCIGLRIKGHTRQPNGKEWVMTTYAFADGEILYLFTLKNIKEYYDENLPLFEQSISTLRIIRQNITKDFPYLLPERALEIEGGATIGLQAGIAKADPDLAIGMYRHVSNPHPVEFFIIIRNETKQKIWADVTVYLGPIPSKSFKAIESNKYYTFIWLAPYIDDLKFPLEIKIFADEKKTRLIGIDKTPLVFENSEIKKLLNAEYNPSKGKIPKISGWKEMRKFAKKIPGTFADSTLQKDIVWKIFKKESLIHKDCEHNIIRVELIDSAKGIRLYKTEDGSLQFDEELNSTGKRFVEKWYVRNCENKSVYEVHLLKSPKGNIYLRFPNINKIGEEVLTYMDKQMIVGDKIWEKILKYPDNPTIAVEVITVGGFNISEFRFYFENKDKSEILINKVIFEVLEVNKFITEEETDIVDKYNLDISHLEKPGDRVDYPMSRLVNSAQRDTFFVALAANHLVKGEFRKWRFFVLLDTNQGIVRAGTHEIYLPYRLDSIVEQEKVELREQIGITPLIEAVGQNDVTLVRSLISASSDVNKITKKPKISPLFVAVMYSNAEIVQILIDAGANVNYVCALGATPLMFAAGQGDSVKLQMLIDAGANLNARDEEGNTALIYAASSIANVRILLKYGANIYQRNKNGESALELARSRGNTQVVKLLHEAETEEKQ